MWKRKASHVSDVIFVCWLIVRETCSNGVDLGLIVPVYVPPGGVLLPHHMRNSIGQVKIDSSILKSHLDVL